MPEYALPMCAPWPGKSQTLSTRTPPHHQGIAEILMRLQTKPQGIGRIRKRPCVCPFGEKFEPAPSRPSTCRSHITGRRSSPGIVKPGPKPATEERSPFALLSLRRRAGLPPRSRAIQTRGRHRLDGESCDSDRSTRVTLCENHHLFAHIPIGGA
jgi:hypothetical protein